MPLALTGWEIGLLSTAAVFIVLALIASMVVPRSRPEFPSRALGWFIAGCIVLFAAQMTAVVLLAEVGEEEHEAVEQPGPGEPGEPEPEPEPGEPTETTPTAPEPTTGETETTPPPAAGGEGDPAAGKEVFTANCGSCHTLADAGTTGSVGPNLDDSQPTVELAVDRVTNGQGVMPPFADTLSEQQIQDVAAYVASASGG